MRYLIIVQMVFFLGFLQLAACDSSMNSQIEKCVAAGVKGSEPYTDSAQKSNTESLIRMACMRAAAGQQ